MDRFLPVEYSSTVLHSIPLFGDGMEVDLGLAPPFMPYDQHVLSPAGAQATLQNGFLDPPFHPTESSQAAVGDSSLRSAQTSPHGASYSAWNNIIAGDIGHSPSFPIPGPSESSVHGSQQASRNDVIVAGAHPVVPHKQREATHIPPYMTTSTPIHGPTPSTNPYPEHVVSWYLMCWNAVVTNGPRKFVPQSIYQPHSRGDKERYVSLAQLHPPIVFLTQDSSEWGIPVQHLLSRQAMRLIEGNEPAFASCGPSIGIRMQWPGYQPCHKQVSTRDYTIKRRMINKAKLAKVVARCIKQFMDTMSKQALQVGSDKRWKVGPFDITVNDIILVSLHHVSQGSWQPQLRLRRTIGNNVTAGLQNHHGS